MKISTKGRYALRMMVDLAEHQNNGFVALRDIAQRQHISKKYLEQIIPILNKPGLLQASRGAQGGYRLAKSPSSYTVGEILRLTEGSLSPVPCVESTAAECPQKDACSVFSMWQGLFDCINTYLDGITLQDILDQHTAQIGNDYHI